MTNGTDMSTPATHGELREAVTKLREELQQALVPMATKADLVPLATKADLVPLATKAELVPLATKAELVPLATKAELMPLATKADLAPLATKAELELWGGALLARIQADLRELSRELTERIELSEQRLSRGARAPCEGVPGVDELHDRGHRREVRGPPVARGPAGGRGVSSRAALSGHAMHQLAGGRGGRRGAPAGCCRLIGGVINRRRTSARQPGLQ